MGKKSRTKGCGHFNLDECCIQCAETLHEWSVRLQDAGFFDIELNEGAKHFSLLESDQPDPTAGQKIEYYSKLYEKTNQEEFENETHEIVMRKASEGAKKIEIVKELSVQGTSIHRGTVRCIIRRYEHKWGIREWTWKQMEMKPPIE